MADSTRDLQRWFEQAGLIPGLRLAATPRELARALSEPGVIEARVEGLKPEGRQLLRLVCRVPRACTREEWDEAGQALYGARSAADLLASGLVVGSGSRTAHLFVPAPLRRRLAGLCPSGQPAPVDGPAAEARWDERGECFRLGLVLAAIERARPRVSGHVALHKSDRAQLLALLAPAFAQSEEAAGMVDMLLRQGLLEHHGSRFGVAHAAVGAADDLGARLARERLGHLDGRRPLLAVLAAVVGDDRWHPLPSLLETAACAALDEPFARVAHDIASVGERLLAWPGVGTRTVDGVTWLRLTNVGRRVTGLEAPVPTHEPRLLIQPNLELVAEPGLDSRSLARLGRIATLKSIGGAAVLRLDEEAVRRAAAEGFDADAMVSFLASVSSRPIPSNVVRTLRDWSGSKGTAQVVTGAVILTDAGELALRRALKGIELQPLQAGVWLVPARKAEAATRALTAAGLSCGRVDGDETALPPDGDGCRRHTWRLLMEGDLERGRRLLERLRLPLSS